MNEFIIVNRNCRLYDEEIVSLAKKGYHGGGEDRFKY
jgi:hypothetical protein